jgi:hypothetical protein
MMAARKLRSVFQLLSRGPLAAPTLLQGAAFFIDLPGALSAQALYQSKCLIGLKFRKSADLSDFAAGKPCRKIQMG